MGAFGEPIHPRFSLADSEFYDDPRRHRGESYFPFVVTEGLDWNDWEHSDDGHWSYFLPPKTALPEQGWKIHLSTRAESSEDVLRIAAMYCHERGLAFKHLRDRETLQAMNAKDADRTASGKFVTIYPTKTEQLQRTLDDLGSLTAQYDGPYILSDLRWTRGPVYVRYGGFLPLFVEKDGMHVAAIRNPAGALVPDERGTVFRPPSWVTVPTFLQPLVAAAKDTTVPVGFPAITKALHFSNAGGVYEAVDAGRTVVVKEGRPLAGVTEDGRDAVARIAQESQVLESLDNPRIVRMIRAFEMHGHRYLVTERVSGRPLSTEVVSRHPLVRADSDSSDERTYRNWALEMCQRVDAAVGELHAAGYTHGDLHPGNFLMRGDRDIVLIDFEMARPIADDAPSSIGAPGFMPNDVRRGVALDRYALACIKLFLFVPLTPLLNADPSKASELTRWAQARFDLPEQWVNDVLEDVVTSASPALESNASSRTDIHVERLRAQLLADATPEREDRLWPGDPTQFTEPPFALAHGALGPLLALHETGTNIPEHLTDWAVHSAQNAKRPGTGLLDGLAGAAVAFRRLGLASASDDALARTLDMEKVHLAPHLYGGLAGLGLAYLELSPTHPELIEEATKVASRLRAQMSQWASGERVSARTGAAGLLRGASGVAVFFLHLYDRTGERELLRLAEAGLRADIRLCTTSADGSLQVDEGWRLFPYLGAGSAGIGHALIQLLDRHPTSSLRTYLPGLTLAAHSEFVYEAGLIQGRAGLIRYLFDLNQRGLAGEADRCALDRHFERLSLHAIDRPEGTGYAGRGLLRRSCDLATGSAGILHTLIATQSGKVKTLSLPFLELPPKASLPLTGAWLRRGGDTYGIPAFVAGDGAA